MLAFSPSDPIPFPISASYDEEKSHSALVDAWLGLEISATEKAIRDPGDDAERWLHVPPSTFLTPYTELRRMLELCPLPAGALVLDIGAGYGRLGHVIHRCSDLRFLGLELVNERVREGSRVLALHCDARAELREADCTTIDLPKADLYFVYDYGTKAAIRHTLEQLRRIARQRKIQVVGRGRAVRDAIEREHPWLSDVITPGHHGNFSIYRSSGG